MEDNIVASAETRLGDLDIRETSPGVFDVVVGGIIRHPGCDTHAVIRALAHYIHGAEYALIKHGL